MDHYLAYITAGHLAEYLLKAHMRAIFDTGPGIYEGDAVRQLTKVAHEMGYRIEKIESGKPVKPEPINEQLLNAAIYLLSRTEGLIRAYRVADPDFEEMLAALNPARAVISDAQAALSAEAANG